MTYTLSIRKEAEADIAEAYQYYEECHTGLGADLMLCIDESLIKVSGAIRPVHYYLPNDKEIVVLAVAHARRNPIHWQSRS